MNIKSQLRETAKFVVRQAAGRLPAPASRFIGKLALDGGTPVRNVRLRPWRKLHDNSWDAWRTGAGAALRSVFLSGIEGLPQPLATKFANQWALYCGCRFGLLLPHGTDALRIGLAAALDHDGLDYGGEIIMPNLSFIASVNAALDRRFGVVFVDVDPGTLLIDPKRVEEAIVPGKTRAIMPVHLFGQPANMTALREIAQRHDLKIIEDSAQAHGAAWETGPAGSLGDVAGFSFQSFKNLHCGEGGALTTNDAVLFERAYALHNVGRARIDGERWGHHSLGWNCRPTEYQAALLLHRFKFLEGEQERRRRNFSRLRELLQEVRCVEPQAIHPGVRKHGAHMFVMRYKKEFCGGISIDDFLSACGAEGAPIYRGYAMTMCDQPALQRLMAKRPNYFRHMPTPVSDRATKELIYISQEIFLGSETDMKEIAAAVKKVETNYSGTGGANVL
jgi:dTDP-4-amino-4,6-dideoxygalactose transaminase